MYLYEHLISEADTRTRGAIGATAETTALERVADVSKPPYRWICALEVDFPSSTGRQPTTVKSTGVLISPRHVLTAAHNVARVSKPTRPDQVSGAPLDAVRIRVSPGLDSTKSAARRRAPVGSVDLKPGDWWLPSQYLASGSFRWAFALLTLPKELPQVDKMTYGHWSDPRYAPLTSVAPVAQGSLLGGTVSLAGYVAGNCSKSCTPCEGTSAAPDSIPLSTGWLSTQAESFGVVVAGGKVHDDEGIVLFTGQTCVGMAGSPVWQKAGSLRLVALHLSSNLNVAYRSPDSRTGYDQRLHVGLAMRDEIVKLLRQRLTIDRVMPTF